MSDMAEKFERQTVSGTTRAMASLMMLKKRRNLEVVEGPESDPKRLRIKLMSGRFSYWNRIKKGSYEQVVSGD